MKVESETFTKKRQNENPTSGDGKLTPSKKPKKHKHVTHPPRTSSKTMKEKFTTGNYALYDSDNPPSSPLSLTPLSNLTTSRTTLFTSMRI